MRSKIPAFLSTIPLAIACGSATHEGRGALPMTSAAAAQHGAHMTVASTFGDDVAFLKQHTDVVVLGDGTGARVAVAPGYQGRVMTSSAHADAGASYGFINREV